MLGSGVHLIRGQGRAGQGRAGQGRAGQGRAGQGRAGQGRAGQGRAGKGSRAGQGRGQGRAGQGRAGQGRAGQGRAGHLFRYRAQSWVLPSSELQEAGERAGSTCAIEVEGLKRRPPTVGGRPKP